MKIKFLIVSAILLIQGCASTIKYEPKPYNSSDSFAYNLMNITSPTPWDLSDANLSLPESYKTEESWGFEASQALVGATNDMSSIGSILSGGASMGLLSLALPETQGTRDIPLTVMFVPADQLDFNEEQIKEKAFKMFSQKVLGIIKENYKSLSKNKSIELDSDIYYKDSFLLGSTYRLNFINSNPSIPLDRCREKCLSMSKVGDLSVSGPYSQEIKGISTTQNEYFVVSYRFLMNAYDPLKIHNYSSLFSDDLFFYHPAYTFNGRLVKGIPAVLSNKGAHLFVKPKTTSISKAQ